MRRADVVETSLASTRSSARFDNARRGYSEAMLAADQQCESKLAIDLLRSLYGCGVGDFGCQFRVCELLSA